MNPHDRNELHIIRSWRSNAAPWSAAVRTDCIPNRALVTNQAILDAVLSVAPRRLLDVGCGEGWLARALAARGTQATGIDAVPELIDQARESACGAAFHVQDYASIAARRWDGGRFDAAVCNFSLLGADSVESLLAALPHHLQPAGHLIIQTLHPVGACGALPYQDGWREGSWGGFGAEFSDPAPWYFRTLDSWHALLARCGFHILECREPAAAGAPAPASIIWIANVRNGPS